MISPNYEKKMKINVLPRNNFSWNNESKKVTRQGMGNAGICVHEKKYFKNTGISYRAIHARTI